MNSPPRVVVTGATGFIGGRIVERLILENRAEVTALTRNYSRAVKVARFPVRMISGSVTDAKAVQAAMEGSEVVFHCAMSVDESSIVEGTRTVCREAINARVKRLVYFSTISVYGTGTTSPINEETPHRPLDDAYSNYKAKAETVVRDFLQQGLNAVILQPTVVYGPGAFWTTFVVQQLKKGTVVLPEGGSGASNAVYVDDVVDAAFLAAFGDRAVDGETFLIAGPTPVTWRQYYEAYAQFIPGSRIKEEAADTLQKAIWRARKKESLLKEAVRIVRSRPDIRSRLLESTVFYAGYRSARALLPRSIWQRLKTNAGTNGRRAQSASDQIVLPELDQIPLLVDQQPVSIERARHSLGYHPRFSLKEGIRLTVEWLRWAGLIQA